MIININTIKEATQYFIKDLNQIPQNVIEKLIQNDFDSLYELTYPTADEKIYSYEYNEELEVIESMEDGSVIVQNPNYDEDTDETETIIISKDKYNFEHYDLLPMWGTMWTFKDSYDEEFVRENIKAVSDCGFRIYEHEDLGIILGIDGAGYDFYEAHWIPLYKAFGFRWHNDIAKEAINE